MIIMAISDGNIITDIIIEGIVIHSNTIENQV